MQAAMWRLTRCIEGRTVFEPQKEVKDRGPTGNTAVSGNPVGTRC